MKQGKSLAELGEELQRQRNARQDFIADTRKIVMQTTPEESTIRLDVGDKLEKFTVGLVAHQQIAARLGIPYRYYQKMQTEQPALLDRNVNTWLQETPEKRMLRVLDGRVRAFLSDRYRRLDNLELCAAVLPVIKEMKGASIESCEVTESRMYLKVINKRMKDEVTVGDAVQAGFVVSNSEVGLGSLRIEPLVYRLVCKNGLICKDFSQRKYHIGRQIEESEDAAYELYRDETLQEADKTFFMMAQDIVRVAADEAKFHLAVNRMREAMHIPLEHEPVQEVELLADKFQLTPGERGDVLRQLFLSEDNTRYGLMNAVTAASQICKDYERATELERIGGEILAMPIPTPLLPESKSQRQIFPRLSAARPVRELASA